MIVESVALNSFESLDSMLLDNLCFAIPTEGALDPSYSFGQKFFDLAMFQWTNLGLLKYFTGRRWTAAEIVRDFDSELSRFPWPTYVLLHFPAFVARAHSRGSRAVFFSQNHGLGIHDDTRNRTRSFQE